MKKSCCPQESAYVCKKGQEEDSMDENSRSSSSFFDAQV